MRKVEDASAGFLMQRDENLISRAVDCWESLAAFRSERERCKQFTYGDQWNDPILDRGVRMRERDYIVSQGNMPLKNNLIRRLVRNVLGVYRNQSRMPECRPGSLTGRCDSEMMNRLLARNREANRLEELYARTMEEFLISGMAVHKKWYGRRAGRSDCHTDHVSPARFFFDTSSRDFRGCDLSVVGEIHELCPSELRAAFAESPAQAEALGRIYGFGADEDCRMKCRVYEVWDRRQPMRLRCHDRLHGRWYMAPPEDVAAVNAENARRRAAGKTATIKTSWVSAEEWRYSFLTPEGIVIRRGVSPYAHGSHPYVFKAYPYIDGEIHSFVSDIIDQQKLTNRLISMYDWILRASAKGVLLFPEGSLPDGADINDIADEWSRFNGVIIYRPRAGVPVPQQVSSGSADIGIMQLLEIQMKMMEDISGVNGALQGKLDSNSISGTLYNQQTQNSLTALADLLKTFDDFVMQATRADISNISQFYSRERLAGNDF